MRVERVSFTVGNTESRIMLLPDGKDINSNNIISILIGGE